ncbi:hypothetical protein BYT27DRAFT_7201508 [Phlegmacium glaucopus]|nr:hypothetical protein BYT27DRAFT_7201508 [Phlegmacium glaucopus]
MDSEALEQPQQTELQQSRPQSDAVNGVSRTSRAALPRNTFLLITWCLAFSSWIISLVSQAIVAATISNAGVRLLWFAIIIQFVLLVEVFEVIISGNIFAYGIQISIFAGLATVFAVLGVDQHIYASPRADKGTGAGWLITAMIDLLWIIYFTSPSDSHFIRLANGLASARPFSGYTYRRNAVEKISRSQDAFVMSAPNGSSDAKPSAGALRLGLDADEYARAMAAADEGLKDEKRQPRTPRTKSERLSFTSSQQGGHRATMSSGVTEGPRGGEKDASAVSSERATSLRPESGTASFYMPETPTQNPTQSKATQSKPLRMAPQPVVPTEPVTEPPTEPAPEPIPKWRAEALFDYAGAPDDPNELSFKKGERLRIIDKSGKWWDAITTDGRRGIAPSNYVRLLI